MEEQRSYKHIDDKDDARRADVFEKPHEAEVLTGDATPGQGDTIEPWEEPDNTRGFQHGSYNYNNDSRYAGDADTGTTGPTISPEQGQDWRDTDE